MLITRALDNTSSFFTSSPVTFTLPAIPYLRRQKAGGNQEGCPDSSEDARAPRHLPYIPLFPSWLQGLQIINTTECVLSHSAGSYPGSEPLWQVPSHPSNTTEFNLTNVQLCPTPASLGALKDGGGVHKVRHIAIIKNFKK